jgi:hypothetical protein
MKFMNFLAEGDTSGRKIESLEPVRLQWVRLSRRAYGKMRYLTR